MMLAVLMILTMIPQLTPAVYADNPFEDVAGSDYFYEPVIWALNHDPQITNGINESYFGAYETCTRGQVVTFLWRASGCPEPSLAENPFADVGKDNYFHKAVLWAVENNITNGMDEAHFGPSEGCTRGQVVTFLWRSQGEPAPVSSHNPFTDVHSAGYFYNAVIWAVGKSVTKGTSDNEFSPYDVCTRGQIVTFLYRTLSSGEEQADDNFIMYAEDISLVGNQGVVFSGEIVSGSIHTGDTFYILALDLETNVPEKYPFWAKKIEIAQEQVNEAEAGDYASIMIDSQDVNLFSKGDVLIGEKVQMERLTGSFVGTFHLYTKDEGARSTPIFDNFKPQITIGYRDYTGTITGLSDQSVGMLKPGDTADGVTISNLTYAAPVFAGQELTLSDSGRTIGTFTVTEIVPEYKNALKQDDFLMYVESLYMITGRGVLLTGDIVNGTVRTGDTIRILSFEAETNEEKIETVEVKGLQVNKTNVDEANAGDTVGILTDSTDISLFRAGDTVVGADSNLQTTTGTLTGTLYLYTKDEGGRQEPIFNNYKPQIQVGTAYYTGTITGISAEEDGMMIPGTLSAGVRISDLSHPTVVYIGQNLMLMDGGKTVGRFTVDAIY